MEAMMLTTARPVGVVLVSTPSRTDLMYAASGQFMKRGGSFSNRSSESIHRYNDEMVPTF
jgi:hypothetical protein